jgi:hypothetical protein
MVRKEFNVDDRRIYLMGHSLVGGGALHMGEKYDEKVGSPWRHWRLRHLLRMDRAVRNSGMSLGSSCRAKTTRRFGQPVRRHVAINFQGALELFLCDDLKIMPVDWIHGTINRGANAGMYYILLADTLSRC